MPLTQAEAVRLLAASAARTTYDATTTSRLHLCTSAPTPTAAGTGVPTGSGSYAPQNISWYAPVGGNPSCTIANNGAVTFAGMPACTVTHAEVYDTANAAVGSSNRKWFGQLANARTTAAGDTITFADSNIVLSLNVA